MLVAVCDLLPEIQVELGVSAGLIVAGLDIGGLLPSSGLSDATVDRAKGELALRLRPVTVTSGPNPFSSGCSDVLTLIRIRRLSSSGEGRIAQFVIKGSSNNWSPKMPFMIATMAACCSGLQ